MKKRRINRFWPNYLFQHLEPDGAEFDGIAADLGVVDDTERTGVQLRHWLFSRFCTM